LAHCLRRENRQTNSEQTACCRVLGYRREGAPPSSLAIFVRGATILDCNGVFTTIRRPDTKFVPPVPTNFVLEFPAPLAQINKKSAGTGREHFARRLLLGLLRQHG
jgi:hypothetical protein